MHQPSTGERQALCRPLAALVDRSPTAVLVTGSDGRCRYGNEAALELFGLTGDELIGRPYDDLIDGHAPHPGHEPTRFHGHSGETSTLPLPLVARHRSGSELEVTIEVIDLSSADEGLTGVIVRDTVTVHRTVRRLSATVEMLAAALSQPDPATVEERAVELGRHVLDADVCVIRNRNGRTSHRTSDRLGGPHIPDGLVDHLHDTLGQLDADQVVRFSRSPSNGDMALPNELPVGEMVVAPIRRDSTTFGHLAAVRLPASRPFPAYAEHMTTEYANAIAMAFDLWNTRDELDRLHWLVDHDRIARDLHDTVIQRLFATAMRLESTIPISDELTAGRIHEAAREIDEVIRDIRTTIFNLRRPATSRGGLRAAVAAEVDGFADAIGVVPRLRFDGVIDGSALPETLTEAVIAVIRELLANVGKHARATAVDVAVSVDDAVLQVVVADDGGGVPHHRVNGDGLANLTRRAEDFGGTFEIGNRPDGAVAVWVVPIRP